MLHSFAAFAAYADLLPLIGALIFGACFAAAFRR